MPRFIVLWKPRHAAAGLAVVVAALMAPGGTGYAGVGVKIDKSSQTMTVSVNGLARYTWPVSTGRRGYGTPTGIFRPQRMARRWFSRIYYNSPMPHSIFFHGGYAIHGTTELRRLGGLASHGCVRLHPANAATLYGLVLEAGPANTQIIIRN